MEQRTEDWYTARVGKITASRIKDLSAKPKAGKCLNDTLTKILAERLSGEPTPTAKNKAMDWGIEYEPLARQAYELATFTTVQEVGLIDHPTIPMSGASPDGLVGDDGLIEIKCPETATHTNTLLTNQAPAEYLPQMMWQMACTGRKWCDFVSFDPRLEPPLQIKIIRVLRDDEVIAELESEVIKANQILNEKILELNNGKCK